MYLDQYLNEYRYMPGIEQLVKCGFYRIVKEKMQGYNTGNLKKKERSCKRYWAKREYYQLLAGKNPSTREYNTTYKCRKRDCIQHGSRFRFFARFPRNFTGCKKNDYRLKISYIYEDEDTITKQIEEIQYSDCAGIILLGTEMEGGDLKPFLNLPIPVVLLDAYFETVPCNCVLINNVQGAYLAARHLIRTCKTQPGYLRSAYQISNFAERSSGFLQGSARGWYVLLPLDRPQPDPFHGRGIYRHAGTDQKWRRTGLLLLCRQRSDCSRRHESLKRKRISDPAGYRYRRIRQPPSW